MQSPKILFVPVSSAEGIGEYMRSIIIANAILKQWPQSTIHFALSRKAPYARDCPFATTLFDKSPTKEVKGVNLLMESIQPDLVVFDAAGRKSQLEKAYKLGAKVIFISQHKRKRSRGMKISRARFTDYHWVVQPDFIIGAISFIDKCKLKLLGKTPPVCVGPIFPPLDCKLQNVILERYNLKKNEYIVFNSGSGGHYLGEKLAADVFAEIAYEGYKQNGVKSLVVYGPNYSKPLPNNIGVIGIRSLSNDEFINLLSLAKGAVLSGGDTLLQAIALKVPTLALPVSKDQPSRITACKTNQLILTSNTDFDSMLLAYNKLLSTNIQRQLKTSLDKLPKLNGLDLCMRDIFKLLGE